MTTTVTSFKDLARQAESLGLYPRVQPGDVYWVPNRLLGFADHSMVCRHPAVVVSVGNLFANIRIMSTKTRQHWNMGVLYHPGDGVRLEGPGVILTRRSVHRRVRLPDLMQCKYAGNVGPQVLESIRVSEQRLDSQDSISANADRGNEYQRELAPAA